MKVPRSIVGRGRGGCRRVAVAAAAVAGLVSVSLAPADDAVAAVEPAAGGVAAASGGGGGYVSITPCRVVDTRKTDEGAMAKNAVRTYQVAGSGSVFAAQGGNPGGCGIPADAAAVEVSITAVAPSSSGFFRVGPAGASIPNATFLNYSKGQGITNTGTVPLGGGQVITKNFSGTAHYVFDIQGYQSTGAAAAYTSVAPCRVVDTRKTSEGAMAKNAARTYQVAGSGSVFAAQGGNPGGCGIPADAAAVEVSITAVAPSSSGFFRAWPAGTSIPNATFLNYSKGQGITNTGTIPIGGSQMSMKNFGGTAHYVLDVQGYFSVPNGPVGEYKSIAPCRVVDTRKTSEGAMAKNAARTYQVAGSGSVFAAQGGNPGGCGIPADAAAVEVSITAVAPSSSGFFRAWPAGTSIPNATFLNYSKGQGITNTGTIPIGGSQMSMKNFGGTAHYVLDVQGYFTASGGTSPTALADVVAITAGDTHACALILGGTVRCWGENDHGQLGDGTQGNIRLTPVAVSGLADVTAIDAGIDYTCAVLTNGTAKCWGYNEWGAVGDGTQGTDRLTPVTVTGLSSIVSISAGGGHTCALIAGGTVKCWGLGVYGQVGDGTGLNRSSPVTVTGLSGVASVSAGGFHTCAALTNGTAMCWGDNDQGNLGDGTIGGEQYAPVAVTGLTGAASVSLGPLHACALLTNGTAKCWGNNDYGELGDGTQAVQPTPVSVTGLADVDSIALGSGHTCAVLTTAIAKCWGHNGSGQVGIGTFTYSEPTPVAVSGLSDVTSIEGGNNYTCARLANSTAKCWGTNGVGELGDGTQDKRTTPVPVIN